MDVFDLRNELIREYEDYVRSFIEPLDTRIRDCIDEEFGRGSLWPEPLIQLNPAFEPGGRIDELVARGLLHPTCQDIFRRKGKGDTGETLLLHRHQVDAIQIARQGASYILTSGTGSGKSLAYIIPIVDYVLRNGSGEGIRAIVVYPMNALVNSQEGELLKFLGKGSSEGESPVTFARYTGQESETKKSEILENPPDILLTNYVMLELILTRPDDQKLVQAAKGLQFLVLDELHTYNGRQGADVAMLVRRLREAVESETLQCIGTSATIVTDGDWNKRREVVANLATTIFGTTVQPEHVIGETLRRVTTQRDFNTPAELAGLRERVLNQKSVTTFEELKEDPLCSWIESNLGVRVEPSTGRLVRAQPQSITGPQGASAILAKLLGDVSEDECRQAITKALLDGFQCLHPDTGLPVFAFRLHQFVSMGEHVYATLEDEATRYLTCHAQRFKPGDRDRVLLPLVFCRECGQEYYSVYGEFEGKALQAVQPRSQYEGPDTDAGVPGYLYVSSEHPWPDPSDNEGLLRRIPDDWLEPSSSGFPVRESVRRYLPQVVPLNTKGERAEGGLRCAWIQAPFRFCLRCGVSYGERQRDDFGKLTALGTRGRSTATTILSLACVRSLHKASSLTKSARKLLSFTDNRQDASLQAGHFNDFVQIGLIRAAVYKACRDAGEDGLSFDKVAQAVRKALDLSKEEFAREPDVKYSAETQTIEALDNVLGYRVYRDLRRGWRVTAPNLEQCGLLRIRYESLQELCADQAPWSECHSILSAATPEQRERLARIVLDHMRRRCAIDVEYLDPETQTRILQQSGSRLRPPWALSEKRLEPASWVRPCPRPPEARGEHRDKEVVYLSARSALGRYLRRKEFAGHDVSDEELHTILRQLLDVLCDVGGIVSREPSPDKSEPPLYRVNAASMRWLAGDGKTPSHDPTRTPNLPQRGLRANPYFVRYYTQTAWEARSVRAAEHTAQVPSELRQEREEHFRSGTLPVLYCSPTMELGVDIADLAAVNMRNVPPTPANYAQRSGRAGRSGQPALVFTFCAQGSPHDQFFFRRPQELVSGAVRPPQIDLENEDLIRAHVHAIWLAASGLSLGRSLTDVLDMSGDMPSLEIVPSIKACLEDRAVQQRAKKAALHVLRDVEPSLKESSWYSEDWLDRVLSGVAASFDAACERWRTLYRAARAQRENQNRIIADHTVPNSERDRAKRLRQEAEAQLELLAGAADSLLGDFYSYRYFASEGFLPGYSFPRLPVTAFVPNPQSSESMHHIQRPRFLAITEFGPRAILYHEGARYVIGRAIRQIGAEGGDGSSLVQTSVVKRCDACGYLYTEQDGNPDLCERCRRNLGAPIQPLLRLAGVYAWLRDRITSDEEERQRLGYLVQTAYRFPRRGEQTTERRATVRCGEETVAEMTYAANAELWRINLRWRNSREPNALGFSMNAETGEWKRSEQEDDDESAEFKKEERVIPFVSDTRNCLIVSPLQDLSLEQMASLQAALKTAVQTCYQIADNELAAEGLPEEDCRKCILIYEAAEGGLGVLRRLVEDPEALPRVAREALRLCHYDDQGNDLGRAEGATEDCEAACYRCLMSYFNQRDHSRLDRKAIRDILLQLAQATVEVSPSAVPRAQHFEALLKACDSDLERQWLQLLQEKNLHLPSHAQEPIEDCGTRPDFLYKDEKVAIYIDGPDHDNADCRRRDIEKDECLENLGYTVIRFRYRENWLELIKRYPYVFGMTS